MKRVRRLGLSCIASVGLVAALLAGPALAQWNGNQQGGYGQSGYGGYGGGGGGGYGNSSFGNSGFGNSGFGNSGFGNSGFGNRGSGSTGLGNSGFGSSGFGGFGNQQSGLGQGMNGGYGQQGMGPGGRNFVGRDAAEVRNNFQQQVGGQQGMQGFNDIIQNLNDMRNQRRRGREQQNAPPLVKVQLRPAFDLPVTSPAVVLDGAQTNLNRTLEVHGSAPISLTMAEGRTVLSGVVASEHQRALIARMAALEPGVGAIDNQLTVATAEPQLQPPKTPADLGPAPAPPVADPQ